MLCKCTRLPLAQRKEMDLIHPSKEANQRNIMQIKLIPRSYRQHFVKDHNYDPNYMKHSFLQTDVNRERMKG